MDHDKVMEFLGQMVDDLGAAGSAGGVAIGYRLGLFRALAEGPATAAAFADRTGCHPRYTTEWLRGQAAAGYVTYTAASGEFSLSDEQAFVLADPNGPNLAAACLTVLGYLRAEPKLSAAFRTGAGVAWHEQDEDVFVGCDAFTAPATSPSWSRTGSRRSTASTRSWRRAPGWPTWAVGWARPPC